jgi:glucose-1-phosphate thymidylyltransferase
MKGVVLAGGLGTRLYPLTRITNKHLLPVYDKPMIYYPIQMLVAAGIRDILVVTGGNNAGDFLRLLQNGKEFGLKGLNFAYQEGEGGIAAALRLARPFAGKDKLCVVLGDNIIEKNIVRQVKRFSSQGRGAKILLKEVAEPRHYGVPEIKDGKVLSIEEKPKSPKSSYAVIGIYLYDQQVFDIIETIKPSKRGELEITDVNNAYIRRRQMTYDILDGWWADSGSSIHGLFEANQFVAQYGANHV